MNIHIAENEKTYTHQSIAKSLRDHGVTTIFGLMGDANLFLIDHFVRHCHGAFVPAAYDGNAVLMALAYAHVSGEVGVGTVTHGPALTIPSRRSLRVRAATFRWFCSPEIRPWRTGAASRASTSVRWWL